MVMALSSANLSAFAENAMRPYAIQNGCGKISERNSQQRSGGTDSPPRKKQGFSRGALLGVFQDILEILARACARKGSNTVEVRKIGDETALKTI